MKDWIKEIIIGIVGIIIGIGLIAYFYKDVIRVILGVIGPLALFFGIIFLWIGIEDKRLEKELQELEKELEEEEKQEEQKQ